MIPYLENLGVILCITIILAWSLNVMVGYAGIFSVMHAVFYGIGAYAGAQFSMHVSTNFFLVSIVAMLFTGAIACIVAVPVLRVRDEYFVVASIGFQMLASTLFITWQSATGGMGGLSGIPPITLFGYAIIDPVIYLILTLACLATCLLILVLLLHSSFGRSLQALRDDEVAAIALGKNPIALRLIATTIAGMLAGLAGVLYAFYITFINPSSFTLDYSVLLVAMVVIGGAGTLVGPVLGAVFIVAFPAFLNFLEVPSSILGPLEQIIYGAVIVILMLFLPGGLVSLGSLGHRYMRSRS